MLNRITRLAGRFMHLVRVVRRNGFAAWLGLVVLAIELLFWHP